MLKILHLLSNWKWTERAEPAADMVLGQTQLGAKVSFVCGRCPFDAPDAVEHRARSKGLDPVAMDLCKHFNPITAALAWPRLTRYLRENAFDIVHPHMINAHLMGGTAARRALPKARIITTFYEAEGPPRGWRQRFLLKGYTDGAVVITPQARDNLVRLFQFPADRIAIIEPGLDVARFDSPLSREAARSLFQLSSQDIVVGMVTRIREARRLDLVLEAVARLAPKMPNLKLMIVGRGGEGAVEEVIEKPAEALGIRSRIVLPGYCRDRMLVAAYKAMDLLAYPFPGTDPSCRTVREAMASGLPVAASRVGYLKTLVREGETGFLTELDSGSLAGALERILTDSALRAKMAQQAVREARERFSSKQQAEKCLTFYEKTGTRR
jgi:glycosyltransferase involved in cell wall biosynthesis